MQIYLKNMCLSYRLKPYYFDTTYRFLTDFPDSVFYYYHLIIIIPLLSSYLGGPKNKFQKEGA